MFGIEILAKLLKVLKSGDTPAQIAFGFAFGMVIGLTPLLSLHNLLLIFLIIILNVNIAAVVFGYFIFGLAAFILDPLFNSIGYYFLVELRGLRNFWTEIYNMPILGASGFNNTVTFGSMLISLILLFPIFWGMKKFVISYRTSLEPKFQKLKIVQLVKGSKVYGFYDKINSWRG